VPPDGPSTTPTIDPTAAMPTTDPTAAMPPLDAPDEPSARPVSAHRSTVLVMAAATGLAVANNYFAQPLLPVIGRSLHLSTGVAGLLVTLAQAGYALGLLLLLPLADMVERRRLVVVLSVATAGGLVVLGTAVSGTVALAAAGAVGTVTVLAQVLVPFAASLAGDHERGRVVGTVMSGLLVGILLARTVAGALAALGTWRVVYVVAAGTMVVQAVVLRFRLPTGRQHTDLRYRSAIASTLGLLVHEPLIRLRATFGMFSFATFSVLWTTMAYMLAARYHFGPAIIGLFGLAGAAGALTATVAGRRSDQRHTRSSTVVATSLLVLSWLALWAGARDLVAFVVGVVVLDIGAQGLHITNQGAIYRIRPEARSRVTSIYMVCYFIGGAAGSVSSTTVYQHFGWTGACALGAAFAACAVLLAVATVTVPPLRRVEAVVAQPTVPAH
jgi:predicted MFS family arabinose efflux permease